MVPSIYQIIVNDFLNFFNKNAPQVITYININISFIDVFIN